jgi:hypothetical protein
MERGERRQHQRFPITRHCMHATFASAKVLEIMNISIGGALLQTDKRMNINREYTIQVEHNGECYPLRGSIAWSVLKESIRDQQGNSMPIYQSGMQFLHIPEKIAHFISSTGNKQNQHEDNAKDGEDFYSLSLETLDMSSEEKEHLERYLSSI